MFASLVLGLAFGWFSEDFWTLFAGLAAFGVAVVSTAQHYQHRTAVLLFLGQPRRLRALAAQCVVAVLITTVLTVISGLTVLPSGEGEQYLSTVTVVPLMAVYGVANATVVRHPTWLFSGYAGWLLFVELLIGRMESPLPFSSFLGAATGRTDALLAFAAWTVAALIAAGWSIRRDLTAD
ncbi:MAG TPA: hypothetical protein VGB74_08065 [Actinoplanes sp.]|jgi:hypothetical protein